MDVSAYLNLVREDRLHLHFRGVPHTRFVSNSAQLSAATSQLLPRSQLQIESRHGGRALVGSLDHVAVDEGKSAGVGEDAGDES